MSDTTPTRAAERLELQEILAFAAPSLGLGFVFLLNAMLLMKFATDVLLIAPATMGLILLGARLWDAVSDPIAGNLSDRTRSRMGRRRPWLLASIAPLALGTWMIWSPPSSLEGNALIGWMVASTLVFYTAITIFGVPYYSLGSELSSDYHERTRVFAFQQGLQISATIGAGMASSAPYYTEHVLGAGKYLPVFMACYVLPGLLLLPVALRLSRRFGKIRVWQGALVLQVFGSLSLATLQHGEFVYACLFVGFLSLGGTTGQVLAPSMQSDVVDYDELETGERKEGAYFAVRSFVLKASFGVGPAMLGFVLSSSGFVPGGEVNEDAIFGMRLLIGYFPAIGALLGALALMRFKLTPAEHARIRGELDARAGAGVR